MDFSSVTAFSLSHWKLGMSQLMLQSDHLEQYRAYLRLRARLDLAGWADRDIFSHD